MTPKTNTTPIWQLRDEIIDARIEAGCIVDVLECYEATFDLREQINLLAEFAEAIECEVAEWWDVDTAKLYNLLRASDNLESAYIARDTSTRDFTRKCMTENIAYFGNQVLQYA